MDFASIMGGHRQEPCTAPANHQAWLDEEVLRVPVGPNTNATRSAAFLTWHFQFSKVRCIDPVLGRIVGARSFDLNALATVVTNGNPNGL
jgi:hypothetical protein